MTTSKTRNRYSTEFKLELIKLIEEHGQSVTQIAAQYQVGVSTLQVGKCAGMQHSMSRKGNC